MQDELTSSLTALAGVLTDRLPLRDTLTEIAQFAVRAIPGADGAGLTMLEDDRAQTAGGTTRYTHTAGGLLASMTTNTGTLVLFGYDDHARRTDTWDKANATHTTWALHTHTAYDPSGRPSHLNADEGTGDSSHTAVSDLSYCYAASSTAPACSTATTDDRSTLQWNKDNLTGAVSSYTYDAGGRLTRVAVTGGPAPTTYTYTYDASGNRLTASTGSTTQTVTYNAANQITSASHTYDGAGNATASPTLGTVTYNGAGQMTKDAPPSGGTGSYTYAGGDHAELVAQTASDGTQVKYTYGTTDPHGLPQVEQVAISGTYGYVEHDPSTGEPLALRTTTGQEVFYVYDGLGHPINLVTTTGTTSTAYTSDPYGVSAAPGANGTPGAQNPYRFAPGGVYDRTTGMIRYGQRWYQPVVGRFSQPDSSTHLNDPVQGNRYAYAGDDPINNTDATGAGSASDGAAIDSSCFGGATIGVAGGLEAGSVYGAALGGIGGCVAGATIEASAQSLDRAGHPNIANVVRLGGLLQDVGDVAELFF